MNPKDVSPNMKFGKLTTICELSQRKQGRVMWKCQCDCGNQTIVARDYLVRGRTKSCGCWKIERQTTHNGSKERLYNIWRAMKDRCNNPNHKYYKNYGGIGVKVCHEWEDYSTFREWAFLNGYDENALFGDCTIDRIDVDGNYEPTNCRWITNQEQQFNKHTNVIIEKDGKKQTLTEWCIELNLNIRAIRSRYRKGCPVEHLFDPIKSRKKIS